MSIVRLTKDNWAGYVTNGIIPVLVDFRAEWCGACRALQPVIESLADRYDGRASICQVDCDDSPELVHKYKVSAIPTVIFFKSSDTPIKTEIGVLSEYDYRQILDQMIRVSPLPAEASKNAADGKP